MSVGNHTPLIAGGSKVELNLPIEHNSSSSHGSTRHSSSEHGSSRHNSGSTCGGHIESAQSSTDTDPAGKTTKTFT